MLPYFGRGSLGWCPSAARPVLPMLVFELSKQQNRTRTTSSTVLVTPPNRTRTKNFPLEELSGGCFLSWLLNWESTESWDFHRLEPYTKPYTKHLGGVLTNKGILQFFPTFSRIGALQGSRGWVRGQTTCKPCRCGACCWRPRSRVARFLIMNLMLSLEKRHLSRSGSVLRSMPPMVVLCQRGPDLSHHLMSNPK